jgi:signal transduction histidine kinase
VRRIVELERLRVRIASDLHDDVGSSLSRIALYSELVREGVAPEDRDRYLGGIADTSRELVTTMGDIVWSIDARNDTLGQMVEKMRGFASTTLGAADITLVFDAEGLDPARRAHPVVRENLYLILKEAVNNVVKHADASRVDISLRNAPEGFVMTVADDGRGEGPTDSPTGHGMKNMRMRAERIGGVLEVSRRGGVLITVRCGRL